MSIREEGKHVDFRKVAEAYRSIEGTSKRGEILAYLVELLQETPAKEIAKVAYLTQGKLYPDFAGIEIGMAEKTALLSVAAVTGSSEQLLEQDLRTTGDLGTTTAHLLQKSKKVPSKKLTVHRVYKSFDDIARSTGEGSTHKRVKLLASLLADAEPDEAKYILRIITGHLRLGVADMTFLDALAVAFGGGLESRPALERAYNITSDLGEIAFVSATEGIDKLRELRIELAKPIRPMLAERVHEPSEIAEKLGEEFIAEYKYDGERVQVHKTGKKVVIFSRRLENITSQYPDVVALARDSISADTAILEGEIVATNPDTGEMLPFQELMRRRRKHGVTQAAKKLPAAIYFFDCLFAEDIDYTGQPYSERREALARSVRLGGLVNLSHNRIIRSSEELESFFEGAIQAGCEGVVAKSIGSDSLYRAGARGWQWIKLKREYRSEMSDSIDLAVVGAYYGRGRRAGVYGSLLMACYDKKTDTFKTVTRLGAGFSDDDLIELPQRLRPYEIDERSPRLKAREMPDVWFEPELVIEIIGAEITLSPIHTCALDRIRGGSGLAIRFPRFTGRYREDKAPEDATTEREIVEMYESKLHKVAA